MASATIKKLRLWKATGLNIDGINTAQYINDINYSVITSTMDEWNTWATVNSLTLTPFNSNWTLSNYGIKFNNYIELSSIFTITAEKLDTTDNTDVQSILNVIGASAIIERNPVGYTYYMLDYPNSEYIIMFHSNLITYWYVLNRATGRSIESETVGGMVGLKNANDSNINTAVSIECPVLVNDNSTYYTGSIHIGNSGSGTGNVRAYLRVIKGSYPSGLTNKTYLTDFLLSIPENKTIFDSSSYKMSKWWR